jgi:hypothetical protein
MVAIARKSVIVQRHSEVLPNTAAVLEAEPEIICFVRMALLNYTPIELSSERQIFESASASRQIPKPFCAAAFPFSAAMR